MARPFTFDKAYYDRYYKNPRTRVVSRSAIDKLAAFVASYVRHLGLPVRRILDIGCGLGLWRRVLEESFPRAKYMGVEISDYLCQRRGWTKGSVVDFRSRHPFDLVICQGILQYLDDRAAGRAIQNLAELSRGALYLEALTVEDWEQNCDRRSTDGGVHLRNGSWYRRRLSRYFRNCGGGVFLALSAETTLFELERLD